MKTYDNDSINSQKNLKNSRREFVNRSIILGSLTDLVQVLRKQHKAGRILTDQIMHLGKMQVRANSDASQKLIKLLSDFNGMYRPHEAREDTVLFPAIWKVISENEYFALGEDFEDQEHELFGKDGFETMVEKVANIERQLGIYDLSVFTPKI
jgi:hemerythrin-like domain-containing protein